MTQDVHDYFVLFDGVCVPVTSISFQWVDEGVTECLINVPGWAETDKIVESTVVEVYHAHARGRVHSRKVVRVPYTSSIVPDEDALRSSFTEECAQTIGEKSQCRTLWSNSTSKRVSFGELTDIENHQLRWVGFVFATSSTTSSQPMSRGRSFSCRSLDALWDSTSLIQLIGGTGTLNQEERRFMGQDSENEKQNGTLLAGTGRRDMANAILAILKERNGNFSVGVRRLLSQYARLVNKSTRHRYETLRALNQMTVVDDDETVQRLIGTNAFDRYFRDSIQSMYMLPLRQALAVILSFVGYRIVPVPSPPYFPIGIQSGTRTESVTSRRSVTRAGALTGTIRWRRWSFSADTTGGNLEEVERFEAAFAAGENPAVDESVGGWIESGEAPVTITPDNLEFSFEIPEGKTSFGATSATLQVRINTYINWVDTPQDPQGSSVGNNVRYLVPGNYELRIKLSGFVNVPPNLYLGVPVDRLSCSMTLSSGQPIQTTATVSEERVVESDPSEETSSLMARLGSYFVTPNLWYAIPPLCNIILPSQIVSKSFSSAGASRITRLVSKVNPGLSGSRKSFVDQFAAPNSSDMNRAVSDADDDLLDARNLTPREYLTGVVAEVSFFDAMSRLVKKEDFEKYLKYRTVQKFWDKNLAGESMQLQIRPTPSLVIGTTALVVVEYGGGDGATDITPEQRALIRRIATLRRWKTQLSRCLASRSSIMGRKSVVRRYLQSLLVSRVTAQNFVENTDIDELPDPSAIEETVGEFDSSQGAYRQFSLNFLETHANTNSGVSSVFREEREITVEREGQSYSIDGSNRLRVYSQGVTSEALISFIGPEAEVIDPGTRRIPELPTISTLTEWIARVDAASDGSECVAALRNDIAVVDAAIEESRTQLAELGGTVKEEQAYIGYVKSIQEQCAPGQHAMSVTLTHVRRVGADIDQDGIAGDDPEATVAFGEDGYLDEKFSISQIGEKLYLPAFGCKSMADHPFVQEALDQEQQTLDENSDVPGADASDIRERMTHTRVCGHSCLDEADAANGEGNGLTATYVVRAFLAKLSEMTDSAIEEWLHDTTQRPGLTLPDAHRNGTLYYSRDERAIAKVPDSFFDEADARLYPDGTTLDGFFSKSFPDIDSSEPTTNMRFHADMTPEERSILTQRRRSAAAVAIRAKNYGYTDK